LGNFGAVSPKGQWTLLTVHQENILYRVMNISGTIIIDFDFMNGFQGDDHPNPGDSYKGTSRTAYLPDNVDGRKILELFKIAWERRVMFRIGTSVTTGEENTVIYNGIHIKTNTKGGTSKYGYPDPTYFTRVQEELSKFGITEQDLEQTILPTSQKHFFF